MGLDIDKNFDANYPTTKIISDGTEKISTIETFERDPEAQKADKKTRGLIQEQTDASIQEGTEITKSRTLDLQKSNKQKQLEIIELNKKVQSGQADLEEIKRLEELKGKKEVKSKLSEWIETNPEKYESIKRPERKPKIRNKNFKKSGGPKLKAPSILNMPFAKFFYDSYFEEAINEGYDEKEARSRAILFTASDVTPGIAEAKFAYESILPRPAGADSDDPFEKLMTKEDAFEQGKQVQALGDEATFRKSVESQLDDEQEVSKDMMLKYKRETALQSMREKTQQRLDNELQQLNIRRQ